MGEVTNATIGLPATRTTGVEAAEVGVAPPMANAIGSSDLMAPFADMAV